MRRRFVGYPSLSVGLAMTMAGTTASAQDARAPLEPVELPEIVVETAQQPAPKSKKKKTVSSQSGPSAAELAAAAGAAEAAAAAEAQRVEQARSVGLVTSVPQSVQVIGRKEITQALQSNPSTSAAIAKLVPGYSVSNGTVSGASETFRGRGVQVMLDGVVLNTPLRDVSRIINLIDLNSVERIEVVAGA